MRRCSLNRLVEMERVNALAAHHHSMGYSKNLQFIAHLFIVNTSLGEVGASGRSEMGSAFDCRTLRT
jgi:hypothetical protein